MSIFHLGSATAARPSAGPHRPLRIPIHPGQETAIGPGCLLAKPPHTGTPNLAEGPQWTRTATLRANGARLTASRTEMTCTIVPGTARGSTIAMLASRSMTPRRALGKCARSASAEARIRLRPTCLPQHVHTNSARSAPGSQTRTRTKGRTRLGTTAPRLGMSPQARTRASARAAPVPDRSAEVRRATTCARRSSAPETTRSPHQARGPRTTLPQTATSQAMLRPHVYAPLRRPRPRPLGERTTRVRDTMRAPGARGSMSTRGSESGSRGTTRGAIRPELGECHCHGRRRRRMGGRMGGTIGGIPFRRAGDWVGCVCGVYVPVPLDLRG